jgi:glycosyltransferase involved in cell wall biosynthesis
LFDESQPGCKVGCSSSFIRLKLGHERTIHRNDRTISTQKTPSSYGEGVSPYLCPLSEQEAFMIVINARFLCQETTGVQRFAEQICYELNRLRTDIVFVAPMNIVNHAGAKKLGVQTFGRFSGHLWEQLELPRYLHTLGSPLLVTLTNTAPILYKNQVATHHDISYIRHPESYSRAFRSTYKLMTPILLRNIRSLITVSQFSATEISNYYNYPMDKIMVIGNAPSKIFAEPQEVRDSSFLLAVSTPAPHKNFANLLQAFNQIRHLFDVELRIVGGHNKSFAHVELSTEASQHQVKLLGRISDAELLDQYQGAYALVVPSLYEGFGLPAIEAQACGCPVISSNAASLPEIMQKSAVFFDPLDVSSIAGAMAEILTNQALRQRLRAEGLVNSARYSWDASALKLSNYLDGLIANQTPDELSQGFPY